MKKFTTFMKTLSKREPRRSNTLIAISIFSTQILVPEPRSPIKGTRADWRSGWFYSQGWENTR